MKKCPACNSSRITASEDGMRCKRCGFTNKRNEKLNEDLELAKEFD